MIVAKLRSFMPLSIFQTVLGVSLLGVLLCESQIAVHAQVPNPEKPNEPKAATQDRLDTPKDPSSNNFGGLGGGSFGGGLGTAPQAMGGLGGPPMGSVMGGSMQSGGTSLGIPVSAIPGRVWVDGGKVIVAIADDGKKAFAYCEQYPRWTPQEIDVKKDVKTIPIVGTTAVAVWHGSICYAFSSELGKWDTLRLPGGESARPSIGGGGLGTNQSESVSVKSQTKGDFLFTNSWGKWFSSDEIKEGKVAEYLQSQDLLKSVEERNVKTQMIQLEQLKASDALRTLQDLFATQRSLSLAIDERTNQIIVRGPELLLEEIVAILENLDRRDESAENKAAERLSHGEQVSVDELRKRFVDLDQQCQQLAAELRKLEQNSDESKKSAKSLSDLVQQAFTARQLLERAELNEFAQRLETARNSIASRERIGEQIIQRRVQELLNPNVNWQPNESAGSKTASPPASMKPPAATKSNKRTASGSAQSMLQNMQGDWIIEQFDAGWENPLVDFDDRKVTLHIDGEQATFRGKLKGAEHVTSHSFTVTSDGKIDFAWDPKDGECTLLGIVACDGESLKVCCGGDCNRQESQRPNHFSPGADILYFEARRRPKTTMQVEMTRIEVGNIKWIVGPSNYTYSGTHISFPAETGSRLQFRATEIDKLPGARIFVTLDLLDLNLDDSARLEEVLKHNNLELPYDSAVLEQANSSNPVKRIVYLPNDLSTAPDDSLFSTLDCGELPSEVDPIEHAKTLGIPILTMQVSKQSTPF